MHLKCINDCSSVQIKGEYSLSSAHVALARIYAMLGQEEKAQHHAAEVLRIRPKWSIKRVAKILHRTYKNQADIDHFINALRKAGLPE